MGQIIASKNLRRFSSPDYVPTESDILRVRVQTSGIVETQIKVENRKFRLVDVGGQRSERKKWIHCFTDVDLLLFVVSLSEYDMTLYEDHNVNRLQESLELFGSIVNSKWFAATAIMLFLNKADLFKEKIKTVDLSVALPDYKGGLDYDRAIKCIQEKFVEQNNNKNKQFFMHVTCATDPDAMETVFRATKEVILSQLLSKTGFGQL